MRYYHDQAASIAGSIDFRQVLTGSEEFSPDILLLHFEYFMLVKYLIPMEISASSPPNLLDRYTSLNTKDGLRYQNVRRTTLLLLVRTITCWESAGRILSDLKKYICEYLMKS